jgi:hypothetical protein
MCCWPLVLFAELLRLEGYEGFKRSQGKVWEWNFKLWRQDHENEG